MQKISNRLAEIDRQLSDSDIYTDQNKQKLQELLLKKTDLDRSHETAENEWFEYNDELDNISNHER
jgi:ATP-binding cassette subfamily F protein 3